MEDGSTVPVISNSTFMVSPCWDTWARLGPLPPLGDRGVCDMEDQGLGELGGVLYLRGRGAGGSGCVAGVNITLALEEEDCLARGAWCSELGSREECEASSHGMTGQRCLWTTGPPSTSNSSFPYSSCSPHPSSCPDGTCDLLELTQPSLCPQDCTKRGKEGS